MSEPRSGSGRAPGRRLRTYSELTGADRSNLLGQVMAHRERVSARLATVRHVVAVVSGKGGVGKSLVSAGLAAALARSGRDVGLLDADLHGPTAARMLGVAASGAGRCASTEVEPKLAACGVRVMSSDLLLEETAPLAGREPGQERFVWRGALRGGVARVSGRRRLGNARRAARRHAAGQRASARPRARARPGRTAATPSMRAAVGPWRSASSSPTSRPERASAAARPALTRLLPTPPFPLTTATT